MRAIRKSEKNWKNKINIDFEERPFDSKDNVRLMSMDTTIGCKNESNQWQLKARWELFGSRKKIEKIRSTLSFNMDRGQRERVMMSWCTVELNFLILNLDWKLLSGTILFSSQWPHDLRQRSNVVEVRRKDFVHGILSLLVDQQIVLDFLSRSMEWCVGVLQASMSVYVTISRCTSSINDWKFIKCGRPIS